MMPMGTRAAISTKPNLNGNNNGININMKNGMIKKEGLGFLEMINTKLENKKAVGSAKIIYMPKTKYLKSKPKTLQNKVRGIAAKSLYVLWLIEVITSWIV